MAGHETPGRPGAIIHLMKKPAIPHADQGPADGGGAVHEPDHVGHVLLGVVDHAPLGPAGFRSGSPKPR